MVSSCAKSPVGTRNAGFTYLGLLFAVATLGIVLSTVGVVWSTEIRRDKEAQLLFVGDQMRDAIGRYRAVNGQYPLALTDLILDEHSPAVRRFLRRIYVDPITNVADWEPIMAPEGGIMGVASPSMQKPIKVAGFSAADSTFEKTDCYCDWRFVYSPRSFHRYRVIRPAS
jgi:type II secretory pathway pseudopilin PulG